MAVPEVDALPVGDLVVFAGEVVETGGVFEAFGEGHGELSGGRHLACEHVVEGVSEFLALVPCL